MTTKHKHTDYDLYEDLERIKDAFSDTAKDIKGKAGDVLAQSIENAREKSLNIRDNLTDYTKEKPYKALGIAVLTGAIIGFLLHRK
jgi:ElaB/YqjD/DUF883 family membrane-anchored ribosome-binding protein